MRDFSREIEPEIQSAIQLVEYHFDKDEGLIQNDESITFESAQEYNPLLIFRWKLRGCSVCGTSFDISTNGFLYKCGECI